MALGALGRFAASATAPLSRQVGVSESRYKNAALAASEGLTESGALSH